MNAIEILQASKNVVLKGWTQRSFASTESGRTCGSKDPEAKCFCSIGAIGKATGIYSTTIASMREHYVYGDVNGKEVAKAKKALAGAMLKSFGANLPSGVDAGRNNENIIISCNDDPSMTQAVVVKCFEDAIKELQNESL